MTITNRSTGQGSIHHGDHHNGDIYEDFEDEETEEIKNLKGEDEEDEDEQTFKALDPLETWFREWNKVFLFICAFGLFVDPLFFYTISINENSMCLFVDGWFAVILTVLKSITDALHVFNMWLHFKMSRKCSRGGGGGCRGTGDESNGERRVRVRGDWSALGYLMAAKGFFLDLFVLLPLPQIVTWVVVPMLLKKGLTTQVMTTILIMFLVQYPVKIYHSICLLRRVQNLFGYIVGTVWLGITLNLIAFFIASHAVGACWYLLGIQRAAQCLKEQCIPKTGCVPKILSCVDHIYYGISSMDKNNHLRLRWGENASARSHCLDSPDNYDYGSYKWVVQIVANDNLLEKILFPLFWGLMTLSTFGNLECGTDWLEIIFIIIVLTTGLLLVTMLIGNIKVFLHATTSKKQAMQLKMRNIEWWMKKRHLPQNFRRRVRTYERHRWAAMRGVDEYEMVKNLPEGLRRDIKYHLCLDLVRQVPLFQHMDNLVLENICDRVKSMIFTQGETITREGDPVQRMLFIVRGHVQSSQVLRDGVESCCMLGPGNFSGDELLSWCLRRPFLERLPPSSSTLVTLETTEAFGIEAEDIRFATQHFRYTFVRDKMKSILRYYSTGWRTWAAVSIQLAWRRYKNRLTLTNPAFIRRPVSRGSSIGSDRLRLYTAMLTSPKPNEEMEIDF